MEVRIGCIGWSYQGWIGPFFPKNMKAEHYLKHYSSIFTSTEINSTFYRIPSRAMVEKWERDTPRTFTFSAKLPKIITHENRLKPTPYLDQFLDVMKLLGKKLRVIVIQLPPSLSFNESQKRLDKMLNRLPNDFHYAIEGRHESWFSEKAIGYMKCRNICQVWNEVEGVSNPAIVTSDFVYIRLIGDRSIGEDQFGKILIDRRAEMEKWWSTIKYLKLSFSMVMISSHFAGFAPESVNHFRKLAGFGELKFIDKNQMTLD